MIKQIVRPLKRITLFTPRTGITKANTAENTGTPLKKGRSLTMPKIPNRIA